MISRLEKAINEFEKAVDTSFAGPIPNSLLARQDLESAIVVLSNRLTPMRDKISRIKGEGNAHLWNQRRRLDSLSDGPLGLIDLFYADGDLPGSTDPYYIQKTAAYKFLGSTAVITGPMIASGRSYIDIEAEVAEATLRRVVQAEEWAIFHGDASINTLSFDGLDTSLTTCVVDKVGAALSSTGVIIPDFDKVIKLIRIQGGDHLDGIFMSFGLQTVVNAVISPASRYFVGMDQDVALHGGANVSSYNSPMGPVPIIGDFFCNPALPYPYNQAGSSGATGGPVSNVYFVRFDGDGMEMVDLMPVGRTELAKLADTVRFYINEYTVYAPKGEPWLGMLTNVSDPA